jgi:hypothetical protein
LGVVVSECITGVFLAIDEGGVGDKGGDEFGDEFVVGVFGAWVGVAAEVPEDVAQNFAGVPQ